MESEQLTTQFLIGNLEMETTRFVNKALAHLNKGTHAKDRFLSMELAVLVYNSYCTEEEHGLGEFILLPGRVSHSSSRKTIKAVRSGLGNKLQKGTFRHIEYVMENRIKGYKGINTFDFHNHCQVSILCTNMFTRTFDIREINPRWADQVKVADPVYSERIKGY